MAEETATVEKEKKTRPLEEIIEEARQKTKQENGEVAKEVAKEVVKGSEDVVDFDDLDDFDPKDGEELIDSFGEPLNDIENIALNAVQMSALQRRSDAEEYMKKEIRAIRADFEQRKEEIEEQESKNLSAVADAAMRTRGLDPEEWQVDMSTRRLVKRRRWDG